MRRAFNTLRRISTDYYRIISDICRGFNEFRAPCTSTVSWIHFGVRIRTRIQSTQNRVSTWRFYGVLPGYRIIQNFVSHIRCQLNTHVVQKYVRRAPYAQHRGIHRVLFCSTVYRRISNSLSLIKYKLNVILCSKYEFLYDIYCKIIIW